MLGFACALLASVGYGMGSILQAMAIADMGNAGAGLDVVGLARVISQWRYLCGLGLDAVGFAATVVALRTLPLFVVESVVASSVGVTAVAARHLLGARLGRRERVALAALVVGLVLLAMAGRPEHAGRLHQPWPMVLLASAALIAVAAVGFGRSSAAWSGLALAALAGATFAAVGIASRALVVPHPWVRLASDPLAYAIVVHGILALLLFAAALQRAPVTTVAAITFAVETVVPAATGLAILGDHARAGFLPVAIIGFGCTVGASIGLARYASPAPASDAGVARDNP